MGKHKKKGEDRKFPQTQFRGRGSGAEKQGKASGKNEKSGKANRKSLLFCRFPGRMKRQKTMLKHKTGQFYRPII